MKNLINFVCVVLFFATFNSCKKNESKSSSELSSVRVVNVVVGGSSLKANTLIPTIPLNGSLQLSFVSGEVPLDLYTTTTPAVHYFNETISTENGGYYTLFLTGNSPTSIERLFIKEEFKNYTDSLCGIRFINLSPNLGPISVNLIGAANGSEIVSLGYKSYSTFKQFKALKTNTNYAFQIRNAATGSLITSTTLTTPRFHNVTVIVRGSNTSPGITTINHY